MVTNVPSFPKTGPILALVALATILISVGAIVSLEIMNAMRGESIGAGAAPRPVVVGADAGGDFAVAAVGGGEGVPLPRLVAVPPPDTRHYPESLKALAQTLIERASGEAGLRLLITAPQRQTKDNFAAVNLARLLTAMDMSTVLLDGNMRTPHIARQLDISDAPGLSDLLSGSTSFADVIRRDPGSRLHVISAGTAQFDPTPLIAAERVEQVLDALEGSYKFILIDSPPVMLSPETRLLANHVDAAVLVGDSLPGGKRLLGRARDMLAEQEGAAVEVIVAEPQVAQPIEETAGEDDQRVA